MRYLILLVSLAFLCCNRNDDVYNGNNIRIVVDCKGCRILHTLPNDSIAEIDSSANGIDLEMKFDTGKVVELLVDSKNNHYYPTLKIISLPKGYTLASQYADNTIFSTYVSAKVPR